MKFGKMLLPLFKYKLDHKLMNQITEELVERRGESAEG